MIWIFGQFFNLHMNNFYSWHSSLHITFLFVCLFPSCFKFLARHLLSFLPYLFMRRCHASNEIDCFALIGAHQHAVIMHKLHDRHGQSILHDL